MDTPVRRPRIDPKYAGYKLAIRKSKIHRFGVYAEERIPANRKVIEYTGERLNRRETKKRGEDLARPGKTAGGSSRPLLELQIARDGLAVPDALCEHPAGERFDLPDGLGLRGPVEHHARQLHHLRNPAAGGLPFRLDCELHGSDQDTSGWANLHGPPAVSSPLQGRR